MSRDACRPDAEVPRDLYRLYASREHGRPHQFAARGGGSPIAKAFMQSIGLEVELASHLLRQERKVRRGVVARLSLQLCTA